MKNYRIAEHPYYHAARCAADAIGTVAGIAWREFVKPVSIVTCGVALGCPIARICGTALGSLWR